MSYWYCCQICAQDHRINSENKDIDNQIKNTEIIIQKAFSILIYELSKVYSDVFHTNKGLLS